MKVKYPTLRRYSGYIITLYKWSYYVAILVLLALCYEKLYYLHNILYLMAYKMGFISGY